MRVIVVGVGEVGYAIAEDLSRQHEVVIVEQDGARVDEASQSIDVLAIEGDGTSLEILEEAGIKRTDMLIASTDNDETNIVCCNAAEVLGDPFTIARVRKPHLLETWNRSPGAFGVNFMVSTNLLAAQAIANVGGLPAARDVDPFEDGRVQLAEFQISEESLVAGLTIDEADRFDSLTFVGVIRNGEVEIAGGATRLQPGDDVVVIGSPESVQGFAAELDPDETPGEEEIVIIGGSEIGFQTARLLEERGFKPRLVERESARAREIAEALPGTMVMESDATDVEFLDREHVGDADVLVAALTRDEDNLLISLLAKRLGVSRTIAVVERSDYVNLFETVGIDVAINPRELTAEEITRFTTRGRTEKVSLVHHDLAEAIEIEVDEASALTGRPISEAMTTLPDQVVIGAIIRDDESVIPRGTTVIEPGDFVILFTATDRVDALLSAI